VLPQHAHRRRRAMDGARRPRRARRRGPLGRHRSGGDEHRVELWARVGGDAPRRVRHNAGSRAPPLLQGALERDMTTSGPRGTVTAIDGKPNLVLTRTFAAPIAQVWAMCTDSGRLERWIGRWEGDPTAGAVDFFMTAERP